MTAPPNNTSFPDKPWPSSWADTRVHVRPGNADTDSLKRYTERITADVKAMSEESLRVAAQHATRIDNLCKEIERLQDIVAEYEVRLTMSQNALDSLLRNKNR